MTTQNDGGSAFPHPSYGQYYEIISSTGMSLRDWFAGMALQGMVIQNDGSYSLQDDTDGIPEVHAEWYATAAYRIADAMILARGLSEGISLKGQQWTKEEMEQIKESEKHNSFLKMNKITEPDKHE